MHWQPDDIHIAMSHGVVVKPGYSYRGLAMWTAMPGSPKGRRKAEWELTHIGTGLYICKIFGSVAQAFSVATEIAEAGDWSFDGIDGYKNQFPDAAERVREILARHVNAYRSIDPIDLVKARRMAAEVMEAREARG